MRNGAPTVTDGPFIEVNEVLAGYSIVDGDGPQQATEIAARRSEAAYDPIEVRQIMTEIPGME